MKFTRLCIALAALAAAPAAWSQAALPGLQAVAAQYSTERWRDQRQAREQQDEARYRVCDALRAEDPATQTISVTTEGRRGLIEALDQAASVPGTLVLLRNASATLRTTPADKALQAAALQAVARARLQLAEELMALGARFREEAAALDLAELSIHLPQLHYQQQLWRLQAYTAAGAMAR